MRHRARPEKQQPLEYRVVQHMQQSAGEPQRGENRHAGMHPHHPQADPQRYDADVLHAVIRQQPLEIMLCQCKQHAQNSRCRADPQDQPGAPARNRPQS